MRKHPSGASKDDKRVINSFLDWYESLTPEDRVRWEWHMGAIIKRMRQ